VFSRHAAVSESGGVLELRVLRVRGPFRGPSGYDHHVREFVRALVDEGVAVELVDLPEWGPARLPDEARDPFFESLNRPVGARTTLHFTMPHQAVPAPGMLNVNYTMFEAIRVPARWVECNRHHDLVIVPTESSRRAWVDSGFPEDRIRLCPLGINPDRFDGAAEPLPLSLADRPISEFRARFLHVSELGPRKNLVGLLRAWLTATTRDDDAILILKLGTYVPGAWDYYQWRLGRLQEEVGKQFDAAAPILVLTMLLSDDDMPRLYAAATHYVSLSHGEGWDQAMVEAAASGLRLIAPDHSAYRAYLDETVATMIPSRQVPARFEAFEGLQEMFAGAEWWETDAESARAAIRHAIDGVDGPAASARARLLEEFTWERSTRRLIEVLSDLEARAGSRWQRLWSRVSTRR
jgi:glycosyltransferase involved in cell wall biosynthesis